MAARFADHGTSWHVDDPAALATRIRLGAVRMVAPQGFGYLGQALSSAEQVAAVFAVARPGVDRLVCSPGHYIIGPFAAAVTLGILGEDAIAAYGKDGSLIEAIGTERSPVADYTCGSLGQGLSAAAGFALSDRMRRRDARTFAMVSDGELEEGQVWEAAMFAGHHRLDRLTVLLDANNSQADGPVDTITTIEPIMPGVSSPGGPSHQAIDDVALMRALPNMTVIDVADAVEVSQVPEAIVDLPGPVYVRLKRGEIPVIFDDEHRLSLTRADVLLEGTDVALFASGMMLASALAAARALGQAGVSTSVVNVPVIKPLDTTTVTAVAAGARVAITAENHSVIGGLGSAVAETLAEAAVGCPLRRVGLRDTFAEGALSGPYLFEKYGLSTKHLIDTAWTALGERGPAPAAPVAAAAEGEYSPV